MKATMIKYLSDKMPKGKHKGKTILHIIKNHTDYAEWMINNMRSIKFSIIITDSLKTWKLLSR